MDHLAQLVLHRRNTVLTELTVFSQQSCQRSPGASLSSHLWLAGRNHQLLEQLRAYQYPEKLIPVVINQVVQRKPIPVYGDGMNVRDWLYVVDHADALWTVLTGGVDGECYNIGGHNEWANIHIVQLICDLVDAQAPNLGGNSRSLITYVKDRPATTAATPSTPASSSVNLVGSPKKPSKPASKKP